MSTLAMKEKKEPKSHSLEILEKINDIRNNLEEVRLYFVREQNNGKFSGELLNRILPALLDLKHIGLTGIKKDLETLQKIKKTLQKAKMNAVIIIHNDTLKEFGFHNNEPKIEFGFHNDRPKIVDLSSDEKEDDELTIEFSLEFEDKYDVLPVDYKNSLKVYFERESFSIFNAAINDGCNLV